MKKLIPALVIALGLSASVYAQDLSPWAEESFSNLNSYGILTQDIVSKNMNANITREEFSSLIMNIYKCDNRIVLSDEDKGVFTDTDCKAVLEAYKVGIVSGKGDGIFEPQSPITRQEIAVMISRTLNLISDSYNKYEGQTSSYSAKYRDADTTADWALSDMAAMCDYKIITGNDLSEVTPLDYATREQAFCMLDRVYSQYINNTSEHTLPKFKSLDTEAIKQGKLIASWPSVVGANGYSIIIKSPKSDALCLTIPLTVTSINDYYENLDGIENYVIYLGVTKSQGVQVFSKPIVIGTKELKKQLPEEVALPESEEKEVSNEIVTETPDWQQILNDMKKTEQNAKEESAEPEPQPVQKPEVTYTPVDNSIIHSTESSALSEKEKRVFPDGIYFESAEVAANYMKSVKVPVWKLNSDGSKISSSLWLEVNAALADDVVQIFTEIYNDPSQFPIKNTGGYCWRNSAAGKLSQHSYGTCIDINWEENYYVKPDGTPITGSHWRPYEDPYSIPEDSIVVKTFAKYGWRWGGNAWGASYSKDYMHFTYLGK